jgi:endo-1,4-beta-mannosidase
MGPGQASRVWRYMYYGIPIAQFMASEVALAEYLAAVLPRLVTVGATGALLWCFADYVQELWDRPPCDQARHERFFGLVRADGSLKPHAEVVKAFAATHPTVQPAPSRRVVLPAGPGSFYSAAWRNTVRLYRAYIKE